MDSATRQRIGRPMSRWLIIAGLAIAAVGILLHYAPGLFNWFGRLPGDIRIESENGRFYFPITSMLVVSAVLSLLLYLLRR
jgi:hypothetical protein